MKLRRRVHIFQGVMLNTLERLLREEGNTPSQLAAIGTLTALAMIIDAADDQGAFAEDDDDVPEVREAASAKG